jgi:hypothetical protein
MFWWIKESTYTQMEQLGRCLFRRDMHMMYMSCEHLKFKTLLVSESLKCTCVCKLVIRSHFGV